MYKRLGFDTKNRLRHAKNCHRGKGIRKRELQALERYYSNILILSSKTRLLKNVILLFYFHIVVEEDKELGRDRLEVLAILEKVRNR